ncbi:MAG: hypothetical protein ABI898_05275 [Sphingomonadales bacterium]
MSRVRIHDAAAKEWRVIGQWTADAIRAQISALELASSIREHEAGTAKSPQLFEVRFLPDTLIDTHAHDADEIMYVVEGEMVVGQRTLLPGSSIFIEGSTLYSFKAGPAGLRVLNFRPCADTTYHSREKFLAARRLADA